jgi:hypothetical protein
VADEEGTVQRGPWRDGRSVERRHPARWAKPSRPASAARPHPSADARAVRAAPAGRHPCPRDRRHSRPPHVAPPGMRLPRPRDDAAHKRQVEGARLWFCDQRRQRSRSTSRHARPLSSARRGLALITGPPERGRCWWPGWPPTRSAEPRVDHVDPDHVRPSVPPTTSRRVPDWPAPIDWSTRIASVDQLLTSAQGGAAGRKTNAGGGMSGSFVSPAVSSGVGETRSFPPASHGVFGFSGMLATIATARCRPRSS